MLSEACLFFHPYIFLLQKHDAAGFKSVILTLSPLSKKTTVQSKPIFCRDFLREIIGTTPLKKRGSGFEQALAPPFFYSVRGAVSIRSSKPTSGMTRKCLMMSPAAYWLHREKPLPFLRPWLVAAKISFLLNPPFLRFRSSSLFSWGKARALLVGPRKRSRRRSGCFWTRLGSECQGILWQVGK